jgi:hypothetical protein
MFYLVAAVAVASFILAFVAWWSRWNLVTFVGSLMLGIGAITLLFLGVGSESSTKQTQAAERSPVQPAAPNKSPTPSPASAPTVIQKIISKPKRVKPKPKVRKKVHKVHRKAKRGVHKRHKIHKATVAHRAVAVQVRTAPTPKRIHHQARQAPVKRPRRTSRVRSTQTAPPPRATATPPPVTRTPPPVTRTAPSQPSGPPIHIGNTRTVHKAPPPKPSAPFHIG